LVSGVIAALCILGTSIDFVQSIYRTLSSWTPRRHSVSTTHQCLLDDEDYFKSDVKQEKDNVINDELLSADSKADLRYISMHNVYIDMKSKLIVPTSN